MFAIGHPVDGDVAVDARRCPWSSFQNREADDSMFLGALKLQGDKSWPQWLA